MFDGNVQLLPLSLARTATLASSAAAHADVVAVKVAHTGRRGRSWTATADHQRVFFDLAASRRWRPPEVLFSSLAHHHLAGAGVAVEVVTEEVGSTATGVTAARFSAAPHLEVELLIAAVAAVAVAVKVTLALFVELSGGIAARHGGSRAESGQRLWGEEVGGEVTRCSGW